MSDDVLELGGARYLPIPIRPAPAPAPEHSSENALAQDRSSSSSNVYEQILAGIEAKQRAPLHEQIEAAGWGFTHSTALTAFVLFVVSEAMEVTVPNVVWDKSIGESTFGTEGHSDTFRSVVTSAPMLGHVLGGLLGGVVADTRGRRAAIYLHSMLFVLASLASAFSRSETCFVLSRAALGLSLGIILPVVVSYMAELAPSSHRARAVVVIPGFGFPCGQILMLMFGLLLHSSEAKDGDDAGLEWWRALLVAGVVPNLLALCLVVMFVPESPHFLLSVGRRADAEEVLQQIAKANSSEHRLIHDGRISLERDSPARTALHGAVATIGGCADAGSAGLRGAELATGFELPESRVQRWKRQALELLSPPLHSYMLSILAMWSFVSFGQLGADVILPKVLQTALDLDMQGRLTALLCITICAWPGFLLTLFALDYRAVTSSRRAVCLGAVHVYMCMHACMHTQVCTTHTPRRAACLGAPSSGLFSLVAPCRMTVLLTVDVPE
jgi:MFS family permease